MKQAVDHDPCHHGCLAHSQSHTQEEGSSHSLTPHQPEATQPVVPINCLSPISNHLEGTKHLPQRKRGDDVDCRHETVFSRATSMTGILQLWRLPWRRYVGYCSCLKSNRGGSKAMQGRKGQEESIEGDVILVKIFSFLVPQMFTQHCSTLT